MILNLNVSADGYKKFGPIRSGRDKNQSEVAEAHLAYFHFTTLDDDHVYLAKIIFMVPGSLTRPIYSRNYLLGALV